MIGALSLGLLGACDDDGGSSSDSSEETETASGTTAGSGTSESGTTAGGPGFGSEEDVSMAATIWTEIQGYDQWAAPPDRDGLIEGSQPHGSWQRWYHNEVADLADGYVVVKVNFTDMMETFDAVTVMKKIDGYDPDTKDWFYAKYMADGTLFENGDGIPMAGLVGKGGAMGCIPCHAAAGGDDYLHYND
jgi:hypothetical protein